MQDLTLDEEREEPIKNEMKIEEIEDDEIEIDDFEE